MKQEFISLVQHWVSFLKSEFVREQLEHPQVLIFDDNEAQFAAKVLAASYLGSDIYLANNDKPETIKSLSVGKSLVLINSELPQVATLDEVAGTSIAGLLFELSNNRGSKLCFYTSGSSGEPKPIVKYWWQLLKEVDVLAQTFALPPLCKFESTVPHYHIYGFLFRVLWPLRFGCDIPKLTQYPEHLVSAIADSKDCVLISSPAFLKRLCKDNVLEQYREHFSFVFSSGGKLEDQYASTLAEQLIPITQVYGSTETGGIAYRQVNDSHPVGWRCFPGVSLESVEQGANLTSPYIVEHNLIINDKIALLEDNTFHLLGRTDRTVKLEEKRIDLTEIETYLEKHSWVDECRVFVLSGERDRLVCAVALTEEGLKQSRTMTGLLAKNILKAYLKNKFELICIPKKWRLMEQLPYNVQGKLPLHLLEELF